MAFLFQISPPIFVVWKSLVNIRSLLVSFLLHSLNCRYPHFTTTQLTISPPPSSILLLMRTLSLTCTWTTYLIPFSFLHLETVLQNPWITFLLHFVTSHLAITSIKMSTVCLSPLYPSPLGIVSTKKSITFLLLFVSSHLVTISINLLMNSLGLSSHSSYQDYSTRKSTTFHPLSKFSRYMAVLNKRLLTSLHISVNSPLADTTGILMSMCQFSTSISYNVLPYPGWIGATLNSRFPSLNSATIWPWCPTKSLCQWMWISLHIKLKYPFSVSFPFPFLTSMPSLSAPDM